MTMQEVKRITEATPGTYRAPVRPACADCGGSMLWEHQNDTICRMCRERRGAAIIAGARADRT